MYMYMYVYVYVYVYVCMYVTIDYSRLVPYPNLPAEELEELVKEQKMREIKKQLNQNVSNVYMYVYICMYMYVYACVYMYVCICICMYVCSMYVCMTGLKLYH